MCAVLRVPHARDRRPAAFDRLGVRLPALAISAWIPERTVVNDIHHHTSLIATLRQRWDPGKPLTARDAAAPSLTPLLSHDQPRAPEDWPDIAPRPVPAFRESLVPRDAPLSPLAKALFHGYLALAGQLGRTVPEIKQDADLTGGQALDIVHETASGLFPGLKMAASQ